MASKLEEEIEQVPAKVRSNIQYKEIALEITIEFRANNFG